MSDMAELLIGSSLVIAALGLLFVSLPRRGRVAWFVRKPVLSSSVPILIITALAMGFVLLAAYFTAIDDGKLIGKKRKAALFPAPVVLVFAVNDRA